MFSFRARRQHAEIAAYLRRICDRSVPNKGLPGRHARLENRYNRTLPVLLWPWSDGRVAGDCLTAATKDVNEHGLGLILTTPITSRELVICLLSDETPGAVP